jgi:hypothetical protein
MRLANGASFPQWSGQKPNYGDRLRSKPGDAVRPRLSCIFSKILEPQKYPKAIKKNNGLLSRFTDIGNATEGLDPPSC